MTVGDFFPALKDVHVKNVEDRGDTVQVIGPTIAQANWGGASTWAALLAARSIGSLAVGLLLLGRIVPRGLFYGRLALAAKIPMLFLLANGNSVLLLLLCGFIAGGAMTFYSAGWRTSLQLHIPPDRLSRVSSFDWLAAMAFPLVDRYRATPGRRRAGVSLAGVQELLGTRSGGGRLSSVRIMTLNRCGAC